MKFVKTDDLKAGMRLAKPIYNKNGVLLYDRNSALTAPGIVSIRNFGLFGIYILEPAEPVPPLSREDLEFEQLQTIYMFKLRECFSTIEKRKKIASLPALLTDIMKHYCNLNHRVNFNQNLRSGEDFVYKHAISTAILVAMMSAQLKFAPQKQMAMITAALLYDIGYLHVPKATLEKSNELSAADRDIIQKALERGLEPLSMYRNDFEFFSRSLALMQAYVYADFPEKFTARPDDELQQMVQILRVADQFDQLTAMSVGHDPVSEIMAMRTFEKDTDHFPPDITSVLAECIHIVPQAASIDLSSGDKGIVLIENTKDFMRPVILRLSDNQIYDLRQDHVYKYLQITDIMKTMDNRVQMDKETLNTYHDELGTTLGEALLAPTRIYVKALKAVKDAGVTVKACSHITGGGFYENIPRMLPEGKRAVVEKNSYPIPPIFTMMAREGQVEEQMMYNTYNMGLGMIVAVDPADVDKTMEAMRSAGDTAYVVGKIIDGEKGVDLV